MLFGFSQYHLFSSANIQLVRLYLHGIVKIEDRKKAKLKKKGKGNRNRNRFAIQNCLRIPMNLLRNIKNYYDEYKPDQVENKEEVNIQVIMNIFKIKTVKFIDMATLQEI